MYADIYGRMEKKGWEMRKTSISRRVYLTFNMIVIALITVSCMVPILNVLATSFSSAAYINAGEVGLVPKGFTLAAYQFVLKDSRFWRSVLVTVERIVIGIPLNIGLSILIAYPLSKSELVFRERKIYVTFFLITMIFSGGMVPTYLLVYNLKMIDTIWALVLPGAVNVFNTIVLMNFFRNLPKAIEESALVDGAGHFTIMMKIFLPLSKPSIATITLFSLINNWNAWFDGLLYNNFTEHYPLQTYLQTTITSSTEVNKVVNNIEDMMLRQSVTARNLTAAKIFIAIVPLMCTYPFLQKHFATGLVMGSVKE